MKRQPTYALFEAWMSDDAIRASFLRSFGTRPERLIRQPASVLAGPVSQTEIDRRRKHAT